MQAAWGSEEDSAGVALPGWAGCCCHPLEVIQERMPSPKVKFRDPTWALSTWGSDSVSFTQNCLWFKEQPVLWSGNVRDDMHENQQFSYGLRKRTLIPGGKGKEIGGFHPVRSGEVESTAWATAGKLVCSFSVEYSFCLLRSCLLILSLLLNLEKITKAYALGLLIYKIEIIVSTL